MNTARVSQPDGFARLATRSPSGRRLVANQGQTGRWILVIPLPVKRRHRGKLLPMAGSSGGQHRVPIPCISSNVCLANCRAQFPALSGKGGRRFVGTAGPSFARSFCYRTTAHGRAKCWPHGDYYSRSVPSTSGHRCSKSSSRWSPRFNRAWIRCCVSGHVSAG